MKNDKRVILIVMDSLGAGALPDAADYGDEDASTINHIVREYPQIKIPTLNSLGYSSIEGVNVPSDRRAPQGCYGRMAEASKGKDTITGHWEIAGLVTEVPFQTFTDTGFPKDFISAFEEKIGTKVIGNYSASGTEIIKELGEEHKNTGYPIVYTSADSVFQIAANTAVIPLDKLYEMCRTAREMLIGELLVGRVIARPFTEENGVYTRTGDRKDYAVNPPQDTILDCIQKSGMAVYAVGKISDIFNGNGITSSVHTNNNNEGIDETLNYMKNCENGLIFTNLVDFDALYGHRRNAVGYGKAIEEFDRRLPEILSSMRADDMLLICADHGNDPVHSGWNHTREYVPLLVYGKNFKPNYNIGTRSSFADAGASICEYLNVKNTTSGSSFLSDILL